MPIMCLGTILAAAVLSIEAPFGRCEIEVPEFVEREFRVSEYGAKADGTKCTEAFAAAMAACEKSGGGRVVVPKGTWLTGAVQFRNNCNLHLEEGATLEFTDDPADYPEVHTTWEGIECYNHSPLLFAYGVTNVAITGKGVISPRMDFWRTWFARPPEHMKATEHLYYWCSTNAPMEARRLIAFDRAHMRPHLIQFNRCGNVLLDGFKIRESPFWMIHLYHSENCVVRNLDTYAHGHNNDGVDVDMTKNVLIENCRFDQGDDGVVLKAGRNADAWRLNRCTENVVVRDCDMGNCHSLLGIGSELSGGVRNVWMTRCTVADTYSMLRIKTGPRRGGFVENVWMDHCRGTRMIRAFNIFMQYCAQWGAFPDFELRRTRIRNVCVSDCEAETAVYGVQLLGDECLQPSGIRISNVKVGCVLRALKDVRNCLDVQIDRLSLASEGSVRLTPEDREVEERLSILAEIVDAAELQDEIDAVSARGGGTVTVRGKREVKPFVLKSNVTLELAEDAVLLASTNIADYTAAEGGRCFVFAEGATNVAIVGKGTINGRGWAFKERKGLKGESQPQALPVMMRFSRCRDLRLEGFTYRDCGAWGCHLRNCDGVTVRRVTCFNHVNNTNDGIDIESSNVVVEDCDIDSDDDAVVFKTESDKSFPVTNVVVRNCRMASCCSALKFGTGSYCDFRDIHIEDCVLDRPKGNFRFNWKNTYADRGVREDLTGLSGMSLEVVDGGRMNNITIRNIDLKGYIVPIFIRLARRHKTADPRGSYLRNVLIENVRGACATSRNGCSITGLPDLRPQNITLRNVSLVFPGGGTEAERDLGVPELESGYPEGVMFGRNLPAWAFYVRHADGIVFENVHLSLGSEDMREMFVQDDVHPRDELSFEAKSGKKKW